MMRSMYSGVSGLRVHQTKMDVIGNNIANVNTVGYKKGQVNFQEVFSELIRGASAPQGGKGGTNPQQIGLGLKLGSINTVHTKGAVQRTNNPTDLMVDGENGYFIVSDDTKFENRYYTRAGNFVVDRAGYLVTPDGYKVLGYKYDEDGNRTSEVGDIRIDMSDMKAPSTTSEVNVSGNLDSRSELPFGVESDGATSPTYTVVKDDSMTYTTDTYIKDSLGNSYKVTLEFEKAVTDGTNEINGGETYSPDEPDLSWVSNKWYMDIKDIEGLPEGVDFQFNGGTDPIAVSFDKNGELSSGSLDIEFIDDSGNVGSAANLPSGFGKYDENAGEFDNTISLDYAGLTQYAVESDAKPKIVQGNSAGTIESYGIDASGVVIGNYSNGEKKALGQIMLAKFDNPMGLQKIGNNFFMDTRNSGEPQVGKPGNSGFGSIASGALEMSNVDLSLEFTEMITTQRGFQANSRVITTTDEMLQELVNLKR